MLDQDDVNTLNKEERAYQRWERETKNKILSMYDTTKKQALWTKYFGVRTEPDDSYLLGNIF